ncbi:CD3324 family protein [Proteiniborus sp. MB09-C3]|uniref:CD3324 family protein n=1 Tax=Proteiniborus sp. MB09-C3 TaxID=3050072 RepID=UPI002556CE95|nr:CD3324 family protein [Proteiniborus sp. MB09-C3]WIV13517.1 CD3324 family protein [Proteiniborus sp. MB09-C3]
MSYKKATNILPEELVELIQDYVDGEYIYIPRKEENRKKWGTKTSARKHLDLRNSNIYKDYLLGVKVNTLAGKYYLSSKSIQRIILHEKNKRVQK